MVITPFPTPNTGNITKPPFETVYEQNYKRIFNAVFMRLLHRQDAEDVTADTFFRAIRAYDGFDPSISSASTWLYHIAMNCLNDYFRRVKRNRTESLDVLREQGDSDPQLESLTDDYSVNTYLILQELKDNERELITMRYVLRLDNQDIARLLGISPRAVSMRYERLLAKCRKIADEKIEKK